MKQKFLETNKSFNDSDDLLKDQDEYLKIL